MMTLEFSLMLLAVNYLDLLSDELFEVIPYQISVRLSWDGTKFLASSVLTCVKASRRDSKIELTLQPKI